MMWVFAVLIVLVLGGVALVAGGFGTPLADAQDDRPDVLVPADRPLGAEDLRRVRFPVVVRGYRMADVDALLARLAAEADRPGAAADAAAGADRAVPAAPAAPEAPDAEVDS